MDLAFLFQKAAALKATQNWNHYRQISVILYNSRPVWQVLFLVMLGVSRLCVRTPLESGAGYLKLDYGLVLILGVYFNKHNIFNKTTLNNTWVDQGLAPIGLWTTRGQN